MPADAARVGPSVTIAGTLTTPTLRSANAPLELIDEIFGPGLLDRLARLEGREKWLRDVRGKE